MYTRIVRKVCKPRAASVIVGIDLSLRGTGLAVLEDGKLTRSVAWTDLKGLQKKHPTMLCWFKLDGNTEAMRQHRITMLADWIVGAVFEANDSSVVRTHVALEGYAFSRNQRGHADIHELGGIVKAALWRAEIPLRVYDPGSIKLASTGSGASEKPAMVKAACTRFAQLSRELPGLLAENEDAAGNIADASLIAALLHEELKVRAGIVPLSSLPERLRRVMLRVTKAEPESLTTRSFIEGKAVDPPEPVLATGRVSE